MVYRYLTVFLVCLICWSSPESFEGDTVPAGWNASAASKLELTHDVAKSGKQCLHWSWRMTGQSLTYTNPEAFAGLVAGEESGSCLGFWLYNEAAARKPLRCELLGADGKVAAWFWFWLDYQGWRPLAIRYKDMIGWSESQAIHSLRIQATDDILFGELFIDYVAPNFVHHGPERSYSTAWVGQDEGMYKREQVILSSDDITLNRNWLPGTDNKFFILKEESADLEKIQRQVLPPVVVPSGAGTADLEAIRARLAAWNIHRNSKGWMMGAPLDHASILKPTDAVDIADFMQLMSEVRTGYLASHSEALRQIFLDLTEFYLTQGYDEGATNMGPLGEGTAFLAWPMIFLDMRDVLGTADETGKAPLRRRVALSMFHHLAGGANALDASPVASVDMLYRGNSALLAAAMMLPDKLERLQRLRIIRRYYNTVLAKPGLLAQGGPLWQHPLHGYSYPAASMKGPTAVAALLRGTQFSLDASINEELDRYQQDVTMAMLRQELPLDFGGRPPWRVLHEDAQTRIYEDPATHVIGYLSTAANAEVPGGTPLISTSGACQLLMEVADKRLALTLPAVDQPLVLRIHGKWKAAELPEGATLQQVDAITTLTLPATSLQPVHATLKKGGWLF